jgi:hypothetical protein
VFVAGSPDTPLRRRIITDDDQLVPNVEFLKAAANDEHWSGAHQAAHVDLHRIGVREHTS